MADIFPESREEEILVSMIDGEEYNKAPESRIEALLLELKEVIEEGGGGGGTTNYNLLQNKPSINSVTLTGDKTSEDLGIPTAADLADKQDVLPVTASGNDVSFNGEIIDGQGNTLSVLAEALTKTASGNPIVITDCTGGKARSLKTTIEAIQDLHGLPFPYVGGAYKNKLPIRSASTVTLYGVTFTFNADGTVKANGTATDNIKINVINGSDSLGKMTLAPNTYTYSIANSLQGVTLGFMNTDKSAFILDGQTGISKTYTVSEAVETIPVFAVSSGVTLNNVMLYPMLEIGSSKTDFAPYSNICPINGRTEARVDDVGKNQLAKAFVYRPDSASTLSDCFPIKAGNYTFSFDKIGTATSWRFGVSLFDKDGNALSDTAHQPISLATFLNNLKLWWTGNDSSNKTLAITIVEDCYIRIWFGGGNTTSAMTATQAQLEEGATATPYEPYVHSSATIQLGTTVYGADINWDTGEMTVKYALLTKNTANMNNGESYPGWSDSGIKAIIGPNHNMQYTNQMLNIGTVFSANTYDNMDTLFLPRAVYGKTETEWKALAIDVQVRAELATPITLQLTPTQLQMLKGYNRVTIDNGTITLDYVSKADSIQAEVDALDANKAEKTTIAPVENGTKASKAYAVGEHFLKDDKFCTAIAAIASGATLTLNTNYVEGTIADNLIKQDTFSGTTTANGNVLLHNSINRKILCAMSDTANQIVTIYPTSSEIWGHVTQNSAEVPVVANTAVSGIYYYI